MTGSAGSTPRSTRSLVDAEGALRAAETAEREIKGGRYRGPLHGIPIALKDNYDSLGVPTRNGSQVFADRMPTQDATYWVRLREAERSSSARPP